MDGFRIQKLTIEGFKGFTKPQEFNIDGRHVFVFGPNAHGKSSLIEAVRWGLFGSTRRQGEVVANARYTGHCRVDIDLVRSGSPLHLHRVLSRGAGGRTDAEVIDQNGTTRSIRQVLPQLDSASAGENVHVIYSPQSGTSRRAPDNIEPFERTVYSHLGLTDAQLVQTLLDSFLMEQEALEKRLGQEIDDARGDVEEEVRNLRTNRGHILDLSPWGSGSVPTVNETESRIRAFISRMDPTGQPSSGASAEALLSQARQSLQKSSNSSVGESRSEFKSLSEDNERLKDLVSSLERVQAEKQNVAAWLKRAEKEIEAKLGASSLQEITEEKEQLLTQIEHQVLMSSVKSQGAEIVGRFTEERLDCPLCGVEHERNELLSAISSAFPDDAQHSLAEQSQHLQNLIDGIADLQGKVENEKKRIDILSSEHTELLHKAEGLVTQGSNASVEESIRTMIGNGQARIDQLLHLLDEGEALVKRDTLELDNLEHEVRLHAIQNRMRNLEQINGAAQEAQETLDTLVSFGETVRSINEAVGEALISWLRNRLPEVTKPMSEAFTALTNHPVYDRLVIPHESLPRLHLRVSSSEDTSELSDPKDVLNGQALSALELVPYFALGQLQEAPVEVFTLLLDDPTQAFDSDHIELLVERLSVLGAATQLLVASHETERFEAALESYFPADSRYILKVESFSRSDGPGFAFVNA